MRLHCRLPGVGGPRPLPARPAPLGGTQHRTADLHTPLPAAGGPGLPAASVARRTRRTNPGQRHGRSTVSSFSPRTPWHCGRVRDWRTVSQPALKPRRHAALASGTPARIRPPIVSRPAGSATPIDCCGLTASTADKPTVTPVRTPPAASPASVRPGRTQPASLPEDHRRSPVRTCESPKIRHRRKPSMLLIVS